MSTRHPEFTFRTPTFIQNMNMVKPWVKELRKRGNVTMDEWKTPMNSYERYKEKEYIETKTLKEATELIDKWLNGEKNDL
jgi:hypothetical protein